MKITVLIIFWHCFLFLSAQNYRREQLDGTKWQQEKTETSLYLKTTKTTTMEFKGNSYISEEYTEFYDTIRGNSQFRHRPPQTFHYYLTKSKQRKIKPQLLEKGNKGKYMVWFIDPNQELILTRIMELTDSTLVLRREVLPPQKGVEYAGYVEPGFRYEYYKSVKK